MLTIPNDMTLTGLFCVQKRHVLNVAVLHSKLSSLDNRVNVNALRLFSMTCYVFDDMLCFRRHAMFSTTCYVFDDMLCFQRHAMFSTTCYTALLQHSHGTNITIYEEANGMSNSELG